MTRRSVLPVIFLVLCGGLACGDDAAILGAWKYSQGATPNFMFAFARETEFTRDGLIYQKEGDDQRPAGTYAVENDTLVVNMKQRTRVVQYRFRIEEISDYKLVTDKGTLLRAKRK